MIQISDKGISLIKRHEGCKLTAYKDVVGVPTIGYGHTKGVVMGDRISQYQADKYLEQDLIPVVQCLNKMGVAFKQGQFDALCSWLFNLGERKFNSSTMKRYILARRTAIEITDQLVRWHYAGNRPLLGLKRRRVDEANMFLGDNIYYLDENNNIKRNNSTLASWQT